MSDLRDFGAASERDGILVVGGRSRAARAYRKYRAGMDGRKSLTVLARQPDSPMVRENIIMVDDYYSLAPSALRGFDVVINFTGAVSGPEMTRVNAEGPAILALRAREGGVRQFIHISSLSVYGRAESIDTATTEAPLTPYGITKLAGDRALAALATPTFKVVLLRAPTLYGPSTGKVTKLANMLVRLRWFPVPSILQPRSILHLENLAMAIELIISRGDDGVMFAADPQPLRLDGLAAAIERIKGMRIYLIRLPEFFFRFLSVILPEIYQSLYARSIVDPRSCVPLPHSRLPSLEAATADILSSTANIENPA